MIVVKPSPRPPLSPVFWVLFWGVLVNRAASFVAVFLALHLTQDLGISKSTAGWIVGAWGIGSLLGSPVSGALADRVGRRATMLTGLGLGGVAVLAIAFASDPRLLLGLSLIGGATQ